MEGNRTEWTGPAQRRAARRHRSTLDVEATMTEQVGAGDVAVSGGQQQPVLTVTAGHRG
jgi:hypothetical protein